MAKPLEPFCFWCGGNARWDFASEPRPFYDNKATFCENCSSARATGDILLFEMSETDPGCGNPTIPGTSVYYTGRWTVVSQDVLPHIIPPDGVKMVTDTGYMCLRHDNYAKFGFDKYPWRTVQ